MNTAPELIDHPSFANACARYFASVTDELTEAMRAKGYARAAVEITFRTNHRLGPVTLYLRTVPWDEVGPRAFPDFAGDTAILHLKHGPTLADLVEQARGLIAAMPDVTGYAADFGGVAA